jgi:hypothetical protein
MVMFSPWTAHYFNFWLMMTISAVVLLTASTIIQRKDLAEIYGFKTSYIFIGIFSAFILYMVFIVGNFAASQLFSFARGQINGIYDLRKQSTPVVIGFLVFLIGPVLFLMPSGTCLSSYYSRSVEFPGGLSQWVSESVV